MQVNCIILLIEGGMIKIAGLLILLMRDGVAVMSACLSNWLQGTVNVVGFGEAGYSV